MQLQLTVGEPENKNRSMAQFTGCSQVIERLTLKREFLLVLIMQFVVVVEFSVSNGMIQCAVYNALFMLEHSCASNRYHRVKDIYVIFLFSHEHSSSTYEHTWLFLLLFMI